MRVVSAVETFPGSVHEAETVWYDTERWPSWVDGLERVERVSDGWPGVGGRVEWESGPAGRGHVRERVVSHEPLAGHTAEVEDDSIRGRQRVVFTPEDDGVSVTLSLEYEIKQRSILTPLVDLLFIRPAFRNSIQNTLRRLGPELATARKPGVG
jgi:Polyketide cyclase / dehydrase and lipid transport